MGSPSLRATRAETRLTVYRAHRHVIQRRGRLAPKIVLRPDVAKTSFSLFLKKHMKTQLILTVLTFTKILLEKSHFTFVARLRRNACASIKVSHVCGRFNILFLRAFFYYKTLPKFDFSRFEKKVLVAPAQLTIFTKHIVKPQWR